MIPGDTQHHKGSNDKGKSKLARIDFVGATLMTLTILSFLFPLEIGGVKIPWSHPLIAGLLGGGCALAGLFLASQAYIAKEPIFPLELLRQRDVMASMIVMACQATAQMGVSLLLKACKKFSEVADACFS